MGVGTPRVPGFSNGELMRDLVKLVTDSPSYIFGRFETIRTAYSLAKRTAQGVPIRKVRLHLSERYGTELSALTISPSGLISTSRTTMTHVLELSRDAFSGGLRLSDAARSGILESARTVELHGAATPRTSYRELLQSPALREREAILSVTSSAQLAEVQALAGDPTLVDVVAGYLGYTPERVSSWLFWSLRNQLTYAEREARYQTVGFHYDVHGLNFLYVNFYITDVDRNSGAHVLIEGSHRGKRLRQLLGTAKVTDSEARRRYGDGRIKCIEGPAGTGFFEDTSCYHKALAPLSDDRLMLQFRYQ